MGSIYQLLPQFLRFKDVNIQGRLSYQNAVGYLQRSIEQNIRYYKIIGWISIGIFIISIPVFFIWGWPQGHNLDEVLDEKTFSGAIFNFLSFSFSRYEVSLGKKRLYDLLADNIDRNKWLKEKIEELTWEEFKTQYK